MIGNEISNHVVMLHWLHSISVSSLTTFSRKSQLLLLFIANNQDLIALIVEFIRIVFNIKIEFRSWKSHFWWHNSKYCGWEENKTSRYWCMISQRFHYLCGLLAWICFQCMKCSELNRLCYGTESNDDASTHDFNCIYSVENNCWAFKCFPIRKHLIHSRSSLKEMILSSRKRTRL